MQQVGKINNWAPFTFNGHIRICGELEVGDTSTDILTSNVVTHGPYHEGQTIQTFNNFYLLGNKAAEVEIKP